LIVRGNFDSVSAMAETSLSITRADGSSAGQRIFRLAGPLTLSTLFPFQAAVREESCSALLVDLTGVSYVDSAGLGSLVGALVTLQRANRRLALIAPNQRVRALIQMSNLQNVFPTFGTVEEAESGLR
jgi:anti-anti-sigma factor